MRRQSAVSRDPRGTAIVSDAFVDRTDYYSILSPMEAIKDVASLPILQEISR